MTITGKRDTLDTGTPDATTTRDDVDVGKVIKFTLGPETATV